MKEFYSVFKTSVALFLAICLIAYGVVVCYWLLYPYNVIDVHSITVMNPNKQVKQGEVLIYEIAYTKYMDSVGVVSRRLVNTYTISYSDMPAHSPAGSRITQTHLPIPEYASPGKYHLLWTVKYPVNPMRTITETVWSDEFEVVENKKLSTKGDRGEQGEQGEPGDKGDKGKQGEPGTPGAPGKKGSGFWPSSEDRHEIKQSSEVTVGG